MKLPIHSFLQSSEWEELQRVYGRKTWRVFDVLVIRYDLPGGFNYLYCPRPRLVTGSWLLAVKEIARAEQSLFLKIEPAEEIPAGEFKNFNFRVSKSLQSSKTLLLDLAKEEKEMLSGMHEKTRYNIRLAEKKGVQIKRGDAFNTFWNMLQETARRDGFHTHPKDYYEKLLAVKTESFSNELFFAKQEGDFLAAAMVNLYRPSKTATYLHGASSSQRREVMAPYLLHWRIIQELKRQNFRDYDLGGIDQVKWPGVTRFKRGFGGEIVEFPPAVDLIFRSHLYRLYKFINFLRAKI